MNYELLIQLAEEENLTYDISELAEPITVTKSIDGTAGKLTCILQKDPNNVLQLVNGSRIRFKVDGFNIFYGYIFTIGTDADGNYKITAYDQLRYLKNSDVMTFKNMTASDIFATICKQYNLKYAVKVPTKYMPPPKQEVGNESLYSIIERGMRLASINDKKRYYIIDDYGTITWSEAEDEGNRLSIVLGDGAGITSFTYEKSIDTDTYNQVMYYRDNKDTGNIDKWIVKDKYNQPRWGILQLSKQADENMNAGEIREYAQKTLDVKNRETEVLKLQGEGINECIAGKRIKFSLPRENIDKWMIIKSSTHKYSKYEHTMDLEVELNV